MKDLLKLLLGVILILAQSDLVMIVELPSAGLNTPQFGTASAQWADNRIELNSVNLSEIQALLRNALPAPQPIPRISPISLPVPKRGPVK